MASGDAPSRPYRIGRPAHEPKGTPISELTPHFEDVQSHYDLSDDFYRLFLDPSQTYSCAYFEPADLTLEEAQLAKIDLSLGKLGLQPGMTLLDVGCGWGSTLLRALERHDVDVVGLTLSENQQRHVEQAFAATSGSRAKSVRLQGWEQFDEPVDRIVSIGAFEHFGADRWEGFFAMAARVLPDDGVMLLHTITRLTMAELEANCIPLSMDAARFARFIGKEIFPGGQLPSIGAVEEHARAAGFTVVRTQSLQMHYARTLDTWAEALAARRDEAIVIQSSEVFDRYMKYLTGCADYFRRKFIDVNQFTLAKTGRAS